MMRFRLNRSAKCPAGNDSVTTGTAMTKPTEPKRGRGMRARVNFPFHRHGEHQTAGDRK